MISVSFTPFAFARRILPVLSCYLCLLPVALFGDDWPHWRGPNRNDKVAETSGWQDGAWPVGDAAWSKNVGWGSTSPIVVEGRLYTLGWYDEHDHLVCLDAVTGKQLWKQSYPSPKYGRHAKGDQGIYSGISSTPEFDGESGYLYTLSTDGLLNCWDTRRDGAKVWGFNLYEKYGVERRPDVGRRTLRDYGYTSSPLVSGDLLLVEVGSESGNLIAFNKRSGSQLWASECKDEAGHSGGPVPMTVEGIPCVAVLTLRNLVVTRLDRGREGELLAQYKWTTDYANNIPTPSVHDNFVLITTAYNHYTICKVEITLQGAKKVWETEHASGVCSPIIHDGHIYWAWRGIHCLDFQTGEEKWLGGKVGSQGSCILTSDDRLIVWANKGDLRLIETAKRSPDKLKVLAEKKGFFRTDAWPHVVLANQRLYVKDRDGNLRCLPIASPPQGASLGPLKWLLVVALVLGIWYALQPRWPIQIVINEHAIKSSRGLTKGQESKVQGFVERDLDVEGKITVRGDAI